MRSLSLTALMLLACHTNQLEDSEEPTSPPVAIAGSDQSVDLEVDCEWEGYALSCPHCEKYAFVLDGGGSYDSADRELSYAWTEATGDLSFNDASLATTTAGTPTVEASVEGEVHTWTVILSVEADDQEDEDSLTLEVRCTGLAPE